MKRPTNTDSRLEDDDMASLFAAQNVDVPKDLKQSVFVQAEHKLMMDTAIDTNDAVTNDRPVHSGGLHANVIAAERTQQYRLHSRARWLAVAATMLMAVAVAPVLINTPDSALNTDSVVSFDLDSAAPESTAQPTALTSPAQTAATTSLTESDHMRNELAVSEETRSNAPSTAPMEALQTINTEQLMNSRATLSNMKTTRQRASDEATGGAAGDSVSDSVRRYSDFTDYRQTASLWIKEIQRLIDLKEHARAKTEYLLFKERHPEHARDFKPDFKALEK